MCECWCYSMGTLCSQGSCRRCPGWQHLVLLSTSGCGNLPNQYLRGELRLCWGDGAHLVLQGLLQGLLQASHTSAWPQGAAGRCARRFSFSNIWCEMGTDPRLGAWKHFQIPPETTLSHLKLVSSPVDCDGFLCMAGFPVGQWPASHKLNCGRGGRKRAL